MSTSQRPYKVALNGYGRIGRCVLRALYERGAKAGFQVVAVNDLADLASIEYLTRFDSTHGRFPGEVRSEGECLHINGDNLQVLRSATPEGIDWASLGVDLVLECSGAYNSRADGQRFLDAGAPRVLFSQPMASEADIDATIVYGVNQQCLTGRETLVSNASCTTNCGVPLLKLLNEAVGLEYASITTIHSAMNDQPVIDAYHHEDLRRTRSAFQSVIPVSTGLARGIERLLPELAGRIQAKAVRVPTVNVYASITTIHSAMNDQPVIDAYHHEDLRRTRSAFQSVIPVSTGLARGIERLLPELAGRIQAKAVRVPTVNVSCLDITLQTARDTDASEINRVLREAAQSGPLKGLVAYTELPHASCDFNHDPHSAIVDGSQTRVSGPRLVNLLAWFDNEWGFANRMLDVAQHYLDVSSHTL